MDCPPPPPPPFEANAPATRAVPPASAQAAAGNHRNTDWADLKAQGTAAFKQGNFSDAVHLWGEAILGAEEKGAALNPQETLAPLHSNLSVALLRLAEGSGLGQNSLALAREHADKCITIRPDWGKGYYRRGEVYMYQKEFKNAAIDFAQAAKLEPGDESIRQRLQEAEQSIGGFIFQQLLCGRDLCLRPNNIVDQQVFAFAAQMANFVYIIADAITREAMVVDACWDIKGVLNWLKAKNLKLVGAIVTHYHFDHTGGEPPAPFDKMGVTVGGVKDLADAGVPVFVHKLDARTVEEKNKVPAESIRAVEHEEVIQCGALRVRCLHTPGHTPGSMCLYLTGNKEEGTGDGKGLLLSGDTLFIGSCGRLDLHDCQPGEMYYSLQKKLAMLPDSTVVFPGHNYGGERTTIGAEKRAGLLRKISEAEWRHQHSAML